MVGEISLSCKTFFLTGSLTGREDEVILGILSADSLNNLYV